MPPVMMFGVTVLLTIRHVSTDGSSLILFNERPHVASISQLLVMTPL